jgi:ribonuclease P protein component
VIPPTGPFPREARIRHSREFREIGSSGRRYAASAFVLQVGAEKVGSGQARLGLTVSRKVGNAVVRNRVKRRIREWFRRDGRALVPGRDLVVIARASAADLPGPALFAELCRVAKGIR